MGILTQKSKLKVAPPTIRIEKVVVKPKPKPQPKAGSSAGPRGTLGAATAAHHPLRRNAASASPLPSSSSYASDHSAQGQARKRKSSSVGPGTTPRRSPASDRVTFDNDSESDDDDWEESIDARKRQRTADSDRVPDPDRMLVSPGLTETQGDGKERPEPRFIHAADLASLALKCSPSLGAPPAEVAVKLQYPGLRQRERYELVSGKDMIDAVPEIIRVIKHVADTYLSDSEALLINDPANGLVRQLERASSPSVQDYKVFRRALDKYNSHVLALRSSGALARNLGSRQALPNDLVAFILEQVYDRTVAPKVELLAKYENGTDNVYGELLHPFINDILIRRLNMTSGQVFVDLGSGVGNVVLQAALDIGCESWGCEMMENACNLAEAQKREFSARCRLWGVAPGRVRLERGDFRTNQRIHQALQRADVVLVNNQAFTSQLNDDLVRMFLDLKSGCKIVSLKSFVHDHKNALNDVGSTILDVEHLTYPEGYVSWTAAGGTFCISTRK
ncbi:hypothetical protein RB601_007095 [Gaeumannomyces tritici]